MAKVSSEATGLVPESPRDVVRDSTDEHLRADVRLLGALLGRVLEADGGAELLDAVERLRALAIDAYEQPTAELRDAAIDAAEALVDELSPARAELVARAFTNYFHLVNLAEEHHRIRRLLDRDTAKRERRTDTLPGAISQLVDELGDEEAGRRVQELRFHPVLTAHPTEARRRAVSSTVRRISDLLTEREGGRLGHAAGLENERRLLEEIEVLWRTDPVRAERPTPLDEVRSAMNVFDKTLFQVIPLVYRKLDDWLLGAAAGSSAALAPAFVRIGSWIGGDRDGNPFVTAKMTNRAMSVASEHVLAGYERAAVRIGRTLTQGASETPESPELAELWKRFAAMSEDRASDVDSRSPGEPHRRALLFVAERISATHRRDPVLGYRSPAEFLAELRVIQSSLRDAGAVRSANGELQHLIWQAETFGFHLAELEVRQHSKVHRQALAELDAQLETGAEPSAQTVEVLDVFRTMAALQSRHGVDAVRRYIVSFTQSVDDLENVYKLAVHACGSPQAAPVLDVIPLFETFADLDNSTTILAGLVELPQTRARLEATGRRLEVMLGYSDSSKDVGPVSATLALYDAQARIAAWAAENELRLTLFHGRGGALGRGGGPANEAVLTQPPGSVEGRYKITEQGEVIFANYGDPVIAARHFEQMASATLLASAPSVGKRNAEASARFAELEHTLDAVSRARFFELVHAEGFAQWFAQVTPQEEVGLLALGSRPARRGLSIESLEDLRAIPWVFAWSQARINLTGWFGLGSALAAIGDESVLREAYEAWPLFRTMVANVELSLAKTDDRLARRFLALGARDDLAALVLDEMSLTREWVLRTTGHDALLDDRRVLQRGVHLRSPYVDALTLLQLRALRELRAVESADASPDARRLMLLAVNGVAAGLQNTG